MKAWQTLSGSMNVPCLIVPMRKEYSSLSTYRILFYFVLKSFTTRRGAIISTPETTYVLQVKYYALVLTGYTDCKPAVPSGVALNAMRRMCPCQVLVRAAYDCKSNMDFVHNFARRQSCPTPTLSRNSFHIRHWPSRMHTYKFCKTTCIA